MTKNYGEIFRDLRITRNLSLKEVAGVHFSAAQLSRFETGKTELTAEKLFYALKKINVSIDEFLLLIDDDYLFSNHLFLEQLEEFTANFHRSKIELYLKEKQQLQSYLTDSAKAEKNQLHISILRSFICDRTSKTIPLSKNDPDQQNVANYLLSIENWRYYELFIFYSVTRTLQPESSFSFLKEIFSKFEEYSIFPENKRLILKILLVCVLFYLEVYRTQPDENLLQMSNFLLRKYASLPIEEHFFLEKFLFQITQGSYRYLTGEQKEGLEQIKTGLSICELLEEKPEMKQSFDDLFLLL